MCALQELCLGFLQVLFKPAKGLIFLVLNSGLGCLIWGANPSLPREHFSTNDIPSSSGFLLRGELLLSSYQTLSGSFFTCRRAILLVSRSISVRVVVLMYGGGMRCEEPSVLLHLHHSPS